MTDTLIEMLENMNKDEFVYIGARHGNGWIFMDTVENVLKSIDSMDLLLKNKSMRILEDARKKLNSIPKKMVECINAMNSKVDEEKKKAIQSRLDELQQEFAGSVKTRKQYERILFKWVPLKDRKVMEIYEHETRPVGTSIVVEGYDRSEYCFFEELYGIGKEKTA